MALKYFFEFTDVQAILHRCEIYNTDFVGDALEINGSLSFDSGSVDNVLEPIRGNGINIALEATIALDFTDLYSDNEFAFQVIYIRNGNTLFDGFLEPEGLYQSYVTDRWIINLTCVDGLSFLKNLSYVEDATGLPFSGKEKEIIIISNCLKRTKVLKSINVSVNVYYTGLSETLCVLDNVYLNSDRFVKEDKGQTIMNCDEVLRSVIEPYNAVLLQFNNEWYIFRLSELISSTTLDFFKFDSDGVFDVMNNAVDLSLTLGSQIDSFYPHWCNNNQGISLKSSIGATRINYKYGLVKSFFNNIYLESVTSPPPILYIEEWTIDDITYLSFPPDNRGVIIEILPLSNPIATPLIVMTSDSFSFGEGNILEFRASYNFYTQGFSGKSNIEIYFKIILTDGVTSYFLNNSGNWTTTDTYIKYQVSTVLVVSFIRSDNMPIDGTVKIEVYTPVRLNTQGTFVDVFLSECYFYPINEELDDIEGENHTVQRETKPSTKIQDTIEVFNGDNPSDVYVGTIYKSDSSTPTETWFRKGITEEFALLRIMGEEILRINANSAKIFEGDVFGYVPLFSVIQINGLTGKYFATENRYNALSNVTTVKLVEVFTSELTDINYELTYDYGNVVEPTIRG